MFTLILIIFLWLSQVLDVWSTNKAIKLPGLTEGNPIVARVMKILGRWWWLYKLPFALLGSWMGWVFPANIYVVFVLIIFILVHLVVAARNWRLHQRFYHS